MTTRDAHPLAALHQGTATGSQLTWQTTILLGPQDMDEAVRIPLAVPLDENVAVAPSDGVHAVVKQGRVVAFDVDPSWHEVAITTRQPLGALSGNVHLGAPILADPAPQIVDVSGDRGVRFEPSPALGLERHIGFYAPPGLSQGARDDAERIVAGFRHRGGDPVYLRADGALAAHGLDGRLTTSDARSHAGMAGAALAFVLVVGALFVAWRKLAREARAEEAEAVLAAEFERMGREGGAHVPPDPGA